MSSGVFRRVVPWFSMSEWNSVYNLVYSDNTEDQQCGLERLVGWKARCPSLPAAVECTLGIFQVLLQDPEHLFENSVSVLREQQLRLMYSTAVMRFLNLILEVKSDDDFGGTMYTKAEKQSIPEWIVNLRHDAAHGTSLPDLSLLRAAAVFIRKWLHEHYWEREAGMMRDWTVSHEDLIALSGDEDELRSIIEVWEALSLYELTGFDNMRQIPDNELKRAISSINGLLLDDNGHVGVKKLNHAKVSTALSVVLRKLVRYFKGKSSSIDKASVLASIIVGGDFLLPSENLMQIMYPDGIDFHDVFEQLPAVLASCCTDLMSTLWDLGAIPALVEELVAVSSNDDETSLRRNMAALWAQKILLSCLKVREARKVRSAILDRLDCKAVYLQYKDLSPGANRKAVMTAVAFAAVVNQRADLRLGYTWKILQIPNALTRLDFIKQAISPLPSKLCLVYLPCLLELANPRVPLESRKLLIDLIYSLNITDDAGTGSSDHKTYSVGDLSSNMRVGANSEANHEDKLTLESDKSHWILSQGHLEWLKCPLGILPWQQQQHNLDKEKYEDSQQRSWCKLSVSGEWAKVSNESVEFEDIQTVQHPSFTIRRVKEGRVRKSIVGKSKPDCGKVIKMMNASPYHRAIDILSEIQTSFCGQTAED